eukprot:804508_1
MKIPPPPLLKPPDKLSNPLSLLKDFEKVDSFSDDHLLTTLRKIQTWPAGEKADLFHWRDVLNRLDEVIALEKSPDELICEVLRVSHLLLRNTGQRKFIYASVEHLTRLLESENVSIVNGAFLVLLEYFSDPHCRATHPLARTDDFKRRVLCMAGGCARSEPEFSLVGLSMDHPGREAELIVKAARFDFVFYRPKSSVSSKMEVDNDVDASSSESEDLEPVFIHVDDIRKIRHSPKMILAQLDAEYDIPERFKFQLLQQLRFALGYADPVTRSSFVHVQLLAMELTISFDWIKNAELVAQMSTDNRSQIRCILDVLKAGKVVPVAIRTRALHVLQLIVHNEHVQTLLRETGALREDGVVSSLLRQCLLDLEDNPESYAQVKFAHTLFTFLEKLVKARPQMLNIGSPSTLDVRSVVRSLLQIVAMRHVRFLKVTVRAASVLYKMFNHNSTARDVFHENHGLDVLCSRLLHLLDFSGPCLLVQGSAIVEEGAEHSRRKKSYLVCELLGLMTASFIRLHRPASFEGLKDGSFATLFKSVIQWCMDEIHATSSSLSNENSQNSKPVSEAPLSSGSAFTQMVQGGMDRVSAASLAAVAPSNTGGRKELFPHEVFASACQLLSVVIQNNPPFLHQLIASEVPQTILNSDILKTKTESFPGFRLVLRVLPDAIRTICLNPRGLELTLVSGQVANLIELVCVPWALPAFDSKTLSHLGKAMDELFRHQRKLLVPGVAAYIKCLESLVEGSDRFPGTIIQFRKCVQHLGTLLDSLMKHSATQFMSQGGLPKLIRLFFHTDCHSPLPVTSPPAGGPDLCAAKFLVPALQNVGTRDNRDRSVLNDELAKALSALTAIINGSAPTHLSGRYLSYPTWPDEAPKLVDKIPEMDEDDTVKLCGPLTNSFERLRSSMVNLSRVECTMVLISKIIRRAPLQSYEQPSFSIVMDKLASTMPEALSALHEQDLTELKSSDAKISALHLRLVELSKQSTPVPDDKKERPDNWSNGSLRCGKKNHIVEVKEEKEEKISSDEFTGSKRKSPSAGKSKKKRRTALRSPRPKATAPLRPDFEALGSALSAGRVSVQQYRALLDTSWVHYSKLVRNLSKLTRARVGGNQAVRAPQSLSEVLVKCLATMLRFLLDNLGEKYPENGSTHAYFEDVVHLCDGVFFSTSTGALVIDSFKVFVREHGLSYVVKLFRKLVIAEVLKNSSDLYEETPSTLRIQSCLCESITFLRKLATSPSCATVHARLRGLVARELGACWTYMATGGEPMSLQFPSELMKIAFDNLAEQLADARVNGANDAGGAQISAADNRHADLVAQIEAMGYPKPKAEAAVVAAGYDVNRAMEWIFTHDNWTAPKEKPIDLGTIITGECFAITPTGVSVADTSAMDTSDDTDQTTSTSSSAQPLESALNHSHDLIVSLVKIDAKNVESSASESVVEFVDSVLGYIRALILGNVINGSLNVDENPKYFAPHSNPDSTEAVLVSVAGLLVSLVSSVRCDDAGVMEKLKDCRRHMILKIILRKLEGLTKSIAVPVRHGLLYIVALLMNKDEKFTEDALKLDVLRIVCQEMNSFAELRTTWPGEKTLKVSVERLGQEDFMLTCARILQTFLEKSEKDSKVTVEKKPEPKSDSKDSDASGRSPMEVTEENLAVDQTSSSSSDSSVVMMRACTSVLRAACQVGPNPRLAASQATAASPASLEAPEVSAGVSEIVLKQILTVLEKLTKDYAVATEFMGIGGVECILGAFYRPSVGRFASSLVHLSCRVMRHVLEEATLVGKSMELSLIRKMVAHALHRAHRLHYSDQQPNVANQAPSKLEEVAMNTTDFSMLFSDVIGENPKMFFSVVKQVCDIKKVSGGISVSLKSFKVPAGILKKETKPQTDTTAASAPSQPSESSQPATLSQSTGISLLVHRVNLLVHRVMLLVHRANLLVQSSHQPTGTSSPPTGTSSQPTGTSSQSTGTSSHATGTSSQPTGTSSQPTGTSSQATGTSSQATGTSNQSGTSSQPT